MIEHLGLETKRTGTHQMGAISATFRLSTGSFPTAVNASISGTPPPSDDVLMYTIEELAGFSR